MLNPGLAGDILKYLLGLTGTNPLPSHSSGVYLALFKTVPTINNAGDGFTNITEPLTTDGNYQRQRLDTTGIEHNQILKALANVSQTVAFDGGTAENRKVTKVWNDDEAILFPYTGETGSGYGEIKGYGIYNSGTRGAGTCIFAEALTTPKTFGADTVPVIPKDALVFTM